MPEAVYDSSVCGVRFLLREQGSGTRLLMQRLFADAGLNPDFGVLAGLGVAADAVALFEILEEG